MFQAFFDRITSARLLRRQHRRARHVQHAGLSFEALERRELMSATIITVAGNGMGGYNRDHIAATKAELSEPSAVGFDSKGNLYIIDDFNERVRMVNAKHIISTVAGNGTTGDSGDGGRGVRRRIPVRRRWRRRCRFPRRYFHCGSRQGPRA